MVKERGRKEAHLKRKGEKKNKKKRESEIVKDGKCTREVCLVSFGFMVHQPL